MPVEAPLRVEVLRGPGRDVVGVTGSLDSSTVSTFEDVVFSPTLCVQPVLLLDLDGVEFLDARGVGSLVAVRQWAESRSAQLVLACTSPQVLRPLHICHLDETLHIVDSIRDPAPRDDTA